MLRLGLTGGIGSGKSTVARHLVALGAALIDADDIGRRCTLAGGLAMPAIEHQFGPQFVLPDGAMDRVRMRDHVFTVPSAKRVLENIIHPLVQQEMMRLAQAATSPCLVFDVPLLVESPHWKSQLDRVLVVDCSVDTQVERVMARNGWPRSQIEAVVHQQSPRARRLAAADWVLSNEGIDMAALQILVQRLARQMGL
jgi:dephospho-CoA kinase